MKKPKSSVGLKGHSVRLADPEAVNVTSYANSIHSNFSAVVRLCVLHTLPKLRSGQLQVADIPRPEE